MRKLLPPACLLILMASTTLLAENWPHWRGPTHDGVSKETGLPVKWSATEGVAWKLELPAYSGSTPIIWGDTIFLNMATASNTGDLELWAVDRNKQAVSWKRPIAGGNHIERKQNMSSPSPVTDGQHVWVMTGVGMLKSFDFAGKELWSRDIQTDYGRFGLNWGYASSPLLHGDALYVQVLHGMKTDDTPYVLRIDKATGKTVWKVDRPTDAILESPDSYTTPALLQYDGKTEIVITGGDVVTGHDSATGKELWRADVLNPTNNRNYRIVASPSIAAGLIIAPSRNNPLVAIRPGGSGDISTSHIAWAFDRGPDVPSPVSDGQYLYVVVDGGVVYCLDVKTGSVVYGPERLPPGTYSASPILADGKIYVTTEQEGLTTVFKAGPKFEVLASNTFGDGCSPYCLSTVAISQGQLFIRSSSNLWVIGQRKKP
ncbi:MAG TPA: PQQ-binding-like beta-propeller repeat protein [Vicinamibacterales bacterium]|nr:PQQ-binding-like beta-propeller repeat protein [Vicinamibacterales bacterium]